jgi:hypothetical protein
MQPTGNELPDSRRDSNLAIEQVTSGFILGGGAPKLQSSTDGRARSGNVDRLALHALPPRPTTRRSLVGRKQYAIRTSFSVRMLHAATIRLLPCVFAIATVVSERDFTPLHHHFKANEPHAATSQTGRLIHGLSPSISRANSAQIGHTLCSPIYRGQAA